MDKLESAASTIIKPTYVKQGLQGISSRQRMLSSLLSERRLPKKGWDDLMIEYALNEFAMMDSNNYPANVGVGEREGRVFSNLVAKRHFHLSHGIGRSGDVSEAQPKAAGSSLILKLTNILAMNAITNICGFSSLKHGIVVPICTGMSLALSLSALKSKNPHAKYVLWPRIDQKSCFKSILAAGLIPIVVENVMVPYPWDQHEGHVDCVGGQLETDVSMLEEEMLKFQIVDEAAVNSENQSKSIPPNEILCVLSTTSCFAPRRPDKVDAIARLCNKYNIAHVINNAYGLQSKATAKLLNRACTVGRVDVVVQSTDKNFMVPVGGAIICSPNAAIVENISKSYAGRASMDPILDVFITLLSMGEDGLKQLLNERERCFDILKDELKSLSTYTYAAPSTNTAVESNGLMRCNVINSPDNPISIAVEFHADMDASPKDSVSGFDINSIGSMLFYNCISGTRVISSTTKATKIGGYTFLNWGSHTNEYSGLPYLTAACAIGMNEDEITAFIANFKKVLRKCNNKLRTTIINTNVVTNIHEADAETV